MMKRLLPLLAAASLAAGPPPARDTGLSSASPLRGKTVLEAKKCVTCHSVWGVGGKLGPDLATSGADQTFQQMASMFWNHTPRMVELLNQRGMEWPTLSEQEMADAISFIYYLKLLDRPGDAGRGRGLFREKRCAECHSVGRDHGRLALDRFGAFVSPVPLAQAMWNAGGAMRGAQEKRGIATPLFSGRDMADLQAFLRTEGKAGAAYLPLPDLAAGEALFRSKGCAGCHDGGRSGPDLAREPLRKSISEICGILWNHSFAMRARMAARGFAPADLGRSELADILAYIYFLHFSRDRGDAVAGAKVFHGKGCSNCHATGGGESKRGPDFASRERRYTMLALATSMWNHAPIMHEAMESEVMRWIKLDPDDMQHLSKYLESLGPPTKGSSK